MPSSERAGVFCPGPLSVRFARVPVDMIARMHREGMPTWGAVLLMTMTHCGEGCGRIWASNSRQDTADALGVPLSSVSNAIRTCKQKGLLETACGGSAGRASVYWVNGCAPEQQPSGNTCAPEEQPISGDGCTLGQQPYGDGCTPEQQPSDGASFGPLGDSPQRLYSKTTTSGCTPRPQPKRTQKSSFNTGLFSDSKDCGRVDPSGAADATAESGEPTPSRGEASYPVTDLKPLGWHGDSLLDMFRGGERHERKCME